MLSGGLRRCGDLGLRKWLNAVRGAQWGILVGTWETAVPRAVWTLEAQLMCQPGTVLVSELKPILRIGLHSALVLRICPRLN